MPNFDPAWIILILVGAIIASGVWQSRQAETRRRMDAREAEERIAEQIKQSDPSPDFAALVHAINTQGRNSRDEENRENKWKAFRETISIFLIGATFGAIALQVREMRKVYDPIKEQADAATTQHIDTLAAIEVAREANKTARDTAAAQIAAMEAQSTAMAGQLNAMKDSNQISRDTLAITQRPFVSVGEPVFKTYVSNVDGEEEWKMWLPVVNTGNSSTKGMHVSYWIGPRKTMEDSYEPSRPSQGSWLMVERTNGQSINLGPRERAPDHTIETTYSKALSWDCDESFIMGQITYGDRFSTAIHMTQFCYIMGGPEDGGSIDGKPVYAQCSDYNCADEQCGAQKAERETQYAAGPPPKPMPPNAAFWFDSPFEPGYGRCANPRPAKHP